MTETTSAPMPRREEVVGLYHEGWSQRAISRQLGIRLAAVQKHLRKAGVQRPTPPPPERTLPEPAPPPLPPDWTGRDFDLAVLLALRQGGRLRQDGARLVFEIPPTLDLAIRQALHDQVDRLLRHAQRERVNLYPCGRCGNRLLLRTPGGVVCSACQPDAVCTWVWAER